MIEVSFIIIEYHSVNEILQCVQNIKNLFLPFNYEVIISSNSQYSQSVRTEIASKSEDVHWAFNENNGGFAYAMNKGLARAKGLFLVIMNPDVQIISGIEGMLYHLKSHDAAGAIAPKVIDNNGIIQDSSRTYLTASSFVIRHIKRLFFSSNILYDKNFDPVNIHSVDWVIGAFIMVKRQVYEITHGLDDHYFLYCEDMDWCTRIRRSGYDIIYYPFAQIKYEGTRSARKSIKYSLIFLRSLFRYWGKFGFFKVKIDNSLT